jgi:hypothetical protein
MAVAADLGTAAEEQVERAAAVALPCVVRAGGQFIDHAARQQYDGISNSSSSTAT